MIALAISGSVFLNEAVKGMSEFLPGVPRDVVKGAIAGAGSEFFASLSDEVRKNVLHAIISAMDKTYALVIVAGAITLVGSIFMPVCPLDPPTNMMCSNLCRGKNCSSRSVTPAKLPIFLSNGYSGRFAWFPLLKHYTALEYGLHGYFHNLDLRPDCLYFLLSLSCI